MTNIRTLILTSAAFALLSATAARADSISITFDSPTLAAVPGQTVTFRGVITNLGSTFIDLNGCSLNLGGQFTTDDCGLFFANAPFFLSPHETAGPFDMFSVTVNVPYTAAAGLQPPGTFTVLGFVELPGSDPTDGSTLNVLAEKTFAIIVTPEPGSAALLLLTAPLAWVLRRRGARER